MCVSDLYSCCCRWVRSPCRSWWPSDSGTIPACWCSARPRGTDESPANTRSCLHTHAHTHTHTRMHPRTHTHTHTHAHTRTHEHTHTYRHACTRAHTHAHTRTHTYIICYRIICIYLYNLSIIDLDNLFR